MHFLQCIIFMNFDNQLIVTWLLCISFIGKIFEHEARNKELKYTYSYTEPYLPRPNNYSRNQIETQKYYNGHSYSFAIFILCIKLKRKMVYT